MIKIIRRNQKKAAAFFGVFLMVSFAFSFGKGGGSTQGDPQVGTVNGTAVHSSDIARAKSEIAALKEYFYIDFPAIGDSDKRPLAFYLLCQEAKAAGVRVGTDQVGPIMNQALFKPEATPEDRDLAREAMSDWILINTRFGQVSAYSKVPRQAVDQFVADTGQQVALDIVQFSADMFTSATTKPTDAAMQKQFDQFADTAPGHPVEPTNPFGFGYKLPIRAGIGYLQYNRDALEKGVIARTNYDWNVQGKTPNEQIAMYMNVVDYYWQVQGSTYYYAHQPEFTRPIANGSPAVLQPLSLVMSDAIQKVREPLIAALGEQLKSHLSETMTADWTAYQKYIAAGSTGPEPVSSVGVPYSSPDYLSKLADSVAKSPMFRVTLTVGQSAGDISADDAATAPMFGSTEMKRFVLDTATLFSASPDPKTPAAVAAMMKPSEPLAIPKNDEMLPASFDPGIVTFARLIDVKASVAPASLAVVAPAVEQDLRTIEAWHLAKDAGDKAVAAVAHGTDLVQTAPVGHSDQFHNLPPITADLENATKNYTMYKLSEALTKITPPLTTDQGESFVKQAFAIMPAFNRASNPHPTTIITVPGQPRLFVAQVRTVTTDWDAGQDGKMFYDTLQARQQLQGQQSQQILKSWFSMDKIISRAGYKPAKGSS